MYDERCKSCFAWGKMPRINDCSIIIMNDGETWADHGKKCPFFKTVEEAEESSRRCYEILKAKGKLYLYDGYRYSSERYRTKEINGDYKHEH